MRLPKRRKVRRHYIMAIALNAFVMGLDLGLAWWGHGNPVGMIWVVSGIIMGVSWMQLLYAMGRDLNYEQFVRDAANGARVEGIITYYGEDED